MTSGLRLSSCPLRGAKGEQCQWPTNARSQSKLNRTPVEENPVAVVIPDSGRVVGVIPVRRRAVAVATQAAATPVRSRVAAATRAVTPVRSRAVVATLVRSRVAADNPFSLTTREKEPDDASGSFFSM